MKVIGLTGGAGSGKSAVAGMLAAKGCLYVSADQLAREVVEPGTPALKEIRDAFGASVIAGDGTLDRGRMAEIVFAEPDAREKLESIIHPRVITRVGEEIARAISQGGHPAMVVEVPLLYESGTEDMMDEVWVVDATEESQIRRMIARDGLTEEQAIGRLRAQMDPRVRAGMADMLIENNGSLRDLAQAVDEAWADALKRWSHETA